MWGTSGVYPTTPEVSVIILATILNVCFNSYVFVFQWKALGIIMTPINVNRFVCF